MTNTRTRMIACIMIVMMAISVIPTQLSNTFADERVTTEAVDEKTKNAPAASTDTKEFLSLEMVVGSKTISEVEANAQATSADKNVATFSDGKIYAHREGNTTVTIPKTNGGTKTIYVSSYYKYPQPKTSIVFDDWVGTKLCKWGKPGNTDYVSDKATLKKDGVLAILWRAKSEGGSTVMQYVRTKDGYEGYVDDSTQSDMPFQAYYSDIKIGDSIYKYPILGGQIKDTAKRWKTSAPNIASVTNATNPSTDGTGGKNQGLVKGLREGTSTITADFERKSKDMNTSSYISVYTPVDNIKGLINKDNSIVKRGADSNSNYIVIELKDKGSEVTISGQCGDYYRIGANKYIAKSSIDIQPTGISLNKPETKIAVGKTEILKATITPSTASNKTVKWSSNNTKIVSVDNAGRIKGIESGNAVVTATTEDGKYKAECNVTVFGSGTNNANITESLTLYLISTGKSGNKLGWKRAKTKGVSFYVVWRSKNKNGSKAKQISGRIPNKSSKKSFSFLDKNAKPKTKYYYSVSGYKKNTKGLVGSNLLKVDTRKLKLTAKANSHKKVTLKWNKISGIKKYELYRSQKGKKKSTKIKTISKGKTTYADKKVKPNKKYTYQIRAIQKKGKTVKSNKVGLYTMHKMKKSKTREYFRKQKGVTIDSKMNMTRYGVRVVDEDAQGKRVNKTIYPAIKYKLNGTNLEIHIFLKFEKLKSTGETAGNVSSTYKTLFKNGVKSRFGKLRINGTTKDFKPGVVFTTSVKFHEMKEGYSGSQKYIKVRLAGECPNCTKKGDHWYHAHTSHYSGPGNASPKTDYTSGWQIDKSNFRIYMPTNGQREDNDNKGKRSKYSNEEYKGTAAHEMGHILGLNDAYELNDEYNKKLKRITKTTETTEITPTGKRANLMYKSDLIKKVLPNDIEMILKAYSDGITNYKDGGRGAFQSYKAHVEKFKNSNTNKINKCYNGKSKVIH